MTRAETLDEHADAASRDRVSDGATGQHSGPSTSWDPYEVWLNRVKRPRDLAASRNNADVKSQPGRVPDKRWY